MPSIFRRVVVALVIVGVQWLVLGRLRMWGAFPDAVILYVAWTGLRYGKKFGAMTGFGLGVLMDALYGTWGIHMFIKTIVGFLVGLFPANERETLVIMPQQAFLGSLVIALLHNGLFVTFLALQSGARSMYLVAALWIGSSVYTAFVGLLAAIFSNR